MYYLYAREVFCNEWDSIAEEWTPGSCQVTALLTISTSFRCFLCLYFDLLVSIIWPTKIHNKDVAQNTQQTRKKHLDIYRENTENEKPIKTQQKREKRVDESRTE